MTIYDALKWAEFFHRDQVDKNNIPYMYHIYGVLNRLTNYSYTVRIVGILHDILEDTEVTIGVLGQTFNDQIIIEAIESVTRLDGENYFDYIRRAKRNKIGKIVKKADLQDNLYRCKLWIELRRDKDSHETLYKDFKSLIKRYTKALEILGENENDTNEYRTTDI